MPRYYFYVLSSTYVMPEYYVQFVTRRIIPTSGQRVETILNRTPLIQFSFKLYLVTGLGHIYPHMSRYILIWNDLFVLCAKMDEISNTTREIWNWSTFKILIAFAYPITLLDKNVYFYTFHVMFYLGKREPLTYKSVALSLFTNWKPFSTHHPSIINFGIK